MNQNDVNLLIGNIKTHTSIKTKEQFNLAIDFFLDNSFDNDRKNLYTELMNSEGLSNLAAAKHFILKNLFFEYILSSITEANDLNHENATNAARLKINELEKLRSVFKTHDGIDYQEFISQAEPQLSKMEVSLLFFKPELKHEELEDIRSAIINALSKRHSVINTKPEFQSKFFNHPLINCLNSYKDYNFIHQQIQSNTFEFGYYENLIKALVKLNTKEINEEFQGFISYLIKEDLTQGFSSILKNKNYKPQYLYELLKNITEGGELSDAFVNKLIVEIKENHTKNFRIDSKQELVENKSSIHSLNDFGFYFNIRDEKIFFHGHETVGTGVDQANQQSNTALSFRGKSIDTIGLTILGGNVTRDDSSQCWVNKAGFKGLLDLTKLEEVAFTGLQFDAIHFKSMALNKPKETNDITSLLESDFLSSNNYIVKTDIPRSKNLINFFVGKNDLELIYEKKNIYLNIFKKNITFLQNVIKTTTTNNQAQYQLVSAPFFDFIKSIKKIERKYNIGIFTQDDIATLSEIIEPLISIPKFNSDIGEAIDDASDLLFVSSNINRTKDYYNLTSLCKNDEEKEFNTSTAPISRYDNKNINLIMKVIRNSDCGLDEVIASMEKYPLSENTSKNMKTKLIHELEEKIDDYCHEHLTYNANKSDRIIEAISHQDGITMELRKGNDIYYNLSDYQISNSNTHYAIEKTLSNLTIDQNNQWQKENNLVLLKSFCYLANLTGSRIICSGEDLEKRIKNNFK